MSYWAVMRGYGSNLLACLTWNYMTVLIEESGSLHNFKTKLHGFDSVLSAIDISSICHFWLLQSVSAT